MEKMMVYQSETGNEIEMKIIGRLIYVGNSFGLQLTNEKTYACVGIEDNWFRIVDDEGEDYLYPIDNPKPLTTSGYTKDELKGGKWKIIDDPTGALKKALDS